MALRPALVWALAGTALLSALALGWPQPADAPALVAVTQRVQERSQALAEAWQRGAAAPGAGQPRPLPREWPQADWLSLKGDPFAPVAAASLTPAAPTHTPLAASAPPPEPPRPPELNLRFLGRFVQPDGQALVYLARGSQSLRVRVGDRLDEGYVVEAIGPDAVVLSHPLGREPRLLPLPPDAPETLNGKTPAR